LTIALNIVTIVELAGKELDDSNFTDLHYGIAMIIVHKSGFYEMF